MSSGINNSKLGEQVPNFNKAEAETVYSGANNTWITLGRDRPSSLDSGYGGLGLEGSGAIDIVAGRMSWDIRTEQDGEPIYCDNNFSIDASRIYLSQKANIDEYLNLTDGTIGQVNGASAIALKADEIRVVARGGIKLVTGTDQHYSDGEVVQFISGIDLIAGNDSRDIQPIPKGDNLVEAIGQVNKRNEEILNLLTDIIINQQLLLTAFATHVHVPPVGPSAIAAGASAPLMAKTINQIVTCANIAQNLATMELKYLNQASEKYINSRNNNTN